MNPDALYFWVPRGRAAALPIGEIASRSGVSVRRIQKCIEIWRSEGKPVCAGDEGIWISADPEEIRNQYRRLRHRAIGQMLNARGLLRAAAHLEGQLTLEL